MYVIWWHKPRQVTCPTVLREDRLPLISYMYLASRLSGKIPTSKFGMFRLPRPELEKLVYFEDGEPPFEAHQTTAGICRPHSEHSSTTGRFKLRSYTESFQRSNEDHEFMPQDPETEVNSELKRLAEEALPLYPLLRDRFLRNEKDSSGRTYHLPYIDELVQSHSLNWPNNGLLRRTQSLIMGMVLLGASMAYGAIRVAAWNYFFPSSLEQLFWWMSSIWVTACAAFWLITNLLVHVVPLINRIWIAYNERRLGRLGTVVITLLCILCGVSYILSRAYIVVEAFVSIRKMPRGVYEMPV
ncbi:hypothetical protein BU23DRAFT_487910 [Bimuria novae-zelandiae CBS 107.79]|uniref:Uncharacterized protein n=1 Tax=Bimuria novae-zelandiae CBS 107.79 TaxID=1447943 RepID=A0A6A5UY00_9PLEO|nr:hypothetical protein BU23DRAFT_487910 [Bimuria novae-zelandiae CBS 107.79]